MNYLLCYAFVICAVVLIREFGQRSTLDRFLVADRQVGGTIGSMSIAASWIWAPAIFISCQTGYKWGFSGLIWFCVPNMLALIIFAPLAARIRRQLPDGYNYIEFLKRGDPSFRNTQLGLQLVMQVVIFAIQLVAGAELLANLTGAKYSYMVVGMALTPFCYTFFSGLRTSVFTDALQYIVIAASAVLILLCFPGSFATIDAHPFHPFDSHLLFEFGLASSLGLIVAIFADHQQWQRAFAIKEGQIVRTFYNAAAMHGLVTLSLGTVGCLIFANGFQPSHVDLVGYEFVQSHYATLFVPIFVVMAMCALISTLDSGLCAFSSLAMKELPTSALSLTSGRRWMILLAVLGAAVALLRPPLLTLWFVGCTIRLSAFIPTIATIVFGVPSTKLHATSTASGLIIGGALFAYGVISGDVYVRTAGMVLTLVIPGVLLACAALPKVWKKFAATQLPAHAVL